MRRHERGERMSVSTSCGTVPTSWEHSQTPTTRPRMATPTPGVVISVKEINGTCPGIGRPMPGEEDVSSSVSMNTEPTCSPGRNCDASSNVELSRHSRPRGSTATRRKKLSNSARGRLRRTDEKGRAVAPRGLAAVFQVAGFTHGRTNSRVDHRAEERQSRFTGSRGCLQDRLMVASQPGKTVPKIEGQLCWLCHDQGGCRLRLFRIMPTTEEEPPAMKLLLLVQSRHGDSVCRSVP
jgi:hypothetical protein